MLDWVVYLKHLQSILLEYNPVRTPTKPTMLRYSRKSLKPSILAKLEYQDLKLESFNHMVKNAVDVEAKAALRRCSSTKKIDQNCLRSSQSANSNLAKSQDSIMKDPQIEKSKV